MSVDKSTDLDHDLEMLVVGLGTMELDIPVAAIHTNMESHDGRIVNEEEVRA